MCLLNNSRTKDGVVGNLAVACNLCAITKDAVVSYLGVVADVNALHKEVVRPNDSLAATMGGTIDYYVFTNDVVVAKYALAFFAYKTEILW